MPPPKLIWSDYQNAIFEDIKNGKDGENTVVIARAGSSKTTSLVEGVKYIPKKKKTLFLAFNKSIQLELDDRINKSYIDIKTLHSCGLATIRAAFGKVAIDPDKTLNIIQAILQEKGFKKFEKQKFDLAFSLCRAVNLCKGTLIDIPSKIDVLLDKFDIDILDMEREEFIKTICQTLRKCKETREVIDYGEMVWFPYIYGMQIKKYDRVFIDEAHDLNAAQLHIALSSCKKNGRILAVCDNFQVIYSWNGVEIESVDLLVKRLNAKVLSLPVSYRCAKNIVKLAQEIVPDIQAAPNAIDGEIKHISEDNFLLQVKPGDFVLSRINAPLIYHCLALLRMGVPANIQGKDVGNNLAYMIKKSEKTTVPEFMKWLDNWKATEIARLRAKNRDPILIIDKAACLETLCEGTHSLDNVLDNIKVLFNDGDSSTRAIFSTIHRSKGLQRERVFILWNTLKRNMTQEELNVEYVAITRTQKNLFIVE
jgi:DNA helicase II / ATP-dependent DNA helicase PcrA